MFSPCSLCCAPIDWETRTTVPIEMPSESHANQSLKIRAHSNSGNRFGSQFSDENHIDHTERILQNIAESNGPSEMYKVLENTPLGQVMSRFLHR